MSWPIPQPSDISDRASGVLERELTRVYTLMNGVPPPDPIDARSPVSIAAIFARVLGMTGFDMWLFQARLGQKLMPDTAVDWLPRHGAIWGVPQDQPVASSGNLVLVGTDGLVLPGGLEFSAPGGAIYDIINAGTIGSSGTIAIGISAEAAGSAGNLAAGVTLTAVTPFDGLISQSGTVDTNGITGGADLESTDDWRTRILARIRQRGGGGDANDFDQWTAEVLQGPMVLAISPGVGLITVAIAMPVMTVGTNGAAVLTSWRVPTSTELDEATAYLNDATNRKPLGAPVVDVIAATLQPVNFTLHLIPDTTATRQAITNTLPFYFVGSDITIGATLDVSRSDAAISEATGVFAFDRSVPSADVAPSTVTSLLTFGTVTFV
jgi:uncharacterized phage protein gp47/JayE